MIYITDLSLCTPRSALSSEAAQGRWQTITYETCSEEPGKGIMLAAASFVDAPEIRLPLHVSGWHSVYIGFWNLHFDYDMAGTTIRVKLSDDPAFIPINEPQPDIDYSGTSLGEAFFKAADLTGRDLIFAKIGGPFARKAYIAYVKLVPLSEEEVVSLLRERSAIEARTLQGAIDGWSYFGSGEYKSKEQLLEMVEKFRYSNVGKLIWACNYGDLTNYPSQTGIFLGGEPKVPIPAIPGNNSYIAGAKVWCETFKELASKGLIPQALIGEHVHQMGLKFDAMFRLSIIGDLPGCREMAGKRPFVRSHPEFRQVTKRGVPTEKASYAFPEVRTFMLSIIQESMERFPFDGANLCFCRGGHHTLYDNPVLEDFRKEFGEDGRGVPFDDPRMAKIRCRYLTTFVRDTRRLLDDIGRRKGKRLELSVMVWRDTEENRLCGCDVETWVKEGMLDSILLLNGGSPQVPPISGDLTRFERISPKFVDTARANNCKVICFSQSYDKQSSLARNLLWGHEAGVDGFGIWDIDGALASSAWGDICDKVSDRAAMESLAEAPSRLKSIKLKTVGGYDVMELAIYSGG